MHYLEICYWKSN